MSFPVYPEYEAVHDEWLKAVPRHWSFLELKHACAVQPSNVDKKTVEGQTHVSLCNYTDVYYNDLIDADIAFMQATATDDQIEKFTLKSGDVIITKDSESTDDIANSAYVPEDLPGVLCGYHLAVLRPRKGISGLFIKWLFDSRLIKARVATLANGLTRVGLSTGAIANLEIPIPPPSEQQAIASFLDTETAKIDALIAEQQRLIELLKEKRQAAISHAITKGLDPHAPMKPSGIEWIGEMPEHWSLPRLGYFARIENGSTPSRDNSAYWEDGSVPWISSGAVNQYRIQEPSEFITDQALAVCPLSLLPRGTVVVGMIGQGKTRGLSAMLDIEAAINQNLAAIVPGPMLESEYLHFVFQSAYGFLREFGRGGQQAALNCEILGALRIPLPPREEQTKICQYARDAVSRIDGLVEQADSAIVLLRERRSALISAAVTGKIDVREHAFEEAV